MTAVAADINSVGESAGDARARSLSLGVARGDRAALAAFYEAWFGWTLAAAARASGRDESFCLDIVQDVMIRVAGRMPPVPSHADLERWMWRVTYRAVLDAFRAERRRGERERVGRPPRADRDTERLEWISWINGELARLDDEERLLLRARFGSAMTLREIGAAVGLTTGAAHGRLRAVIKRIRQRSEEEDHVR